MKKENHSVIRTLAYHVLVLRISIQNAKNEILKTVCDLFRIHSTNSKLEIERSAEEIEYLTQFANAFGYDVEEFIGIYTEQEKQQ
jgi:hypothetical protein